MDPIPTNEIAEIPLSLVVAVEGLFLDATPNLLDTPQEIGFRLGRRAVAQWLRSVYAAQQEEDSGEGRRLLNKNV